MNMLFSPDERQRIVRDLRNAGIERLIPDPRLRADLQAFLANGSVDAIQDRRIVNLINEMRARPPGAISEQDIRRVLSEHVAPLIDAFAPDAPTHAMLTDMLRDPNLPIRGDEASQRAFAQDYMRRHFGQHSPQQGRGFFEAYAAAGFPQGKKLRTFYTGYLRQTQPGLSDRDIKATVDSLMEQTRQDRGGFLGLPAGCLIPLAFLSVMAFMFAVTGVLLALFVGQSLSWRAISDSEPGQALSGALALTSVGASGYFWFRRQMQSFALIARLTVIAVVFAGGAALLFEADILNIDEFAAATNTNRQEVLEIGLLSVALVSGALVWARRKVMNIVWTALLLLVIVVAALIALNGGDLDLSALFERASNSGGSFQ